MNAIIVSNPKQKGATDGAIAIFRALAQLYPELKLKTQVVDSIVDVLSRPDIICSVGPDTTHFALEIYDKYQDCIMVGIKDPFEENSPVEWYDKWVFICDTMGTMKDTLVYNARPELVYIPPFPPFSLNKRDLDEAKNDPILEVFRPDIAIVIGGADPYTNYDLTEEDVVALHYIVDRIDLEYGLNVAFITSPRTNDMIRGSLDGWNHCENVAFYDYHTKQLKVGGKTHDCPSFLKPAMAVAKLIIPTDDSLSMMAEATVAETDVLIYKTYLTDGFSTGVPAVRREEVCKYICKMAGVVAIDWRITWDGEENPCIKGLKASSLEGIVDNDIAERLYKAIA